MEQECNTEDISLSANQQSTEQEDISKEAVRIQNLVNSGVLNYQQGQYCMSQLAKKSMERLAQDQIPTVDKSLEINPFEEFAKLKPKFFNGEARSDVLNYLQNSNFIVDKDEICLISDLVEKIEKSAVDRYIKQQNHEKILNETNEAAKRKLTANAQNSTSAFSNINKIFTREQIGRMSGAEFTKNEDLIMEQMMKGLIM